MSGAEPVRIAIASDKFKGSLTAPEVAEWFTVGVQRVIPDATVVAIPVADGGEGTLDAALAAGFERRRATVSGPSDEPVEADFAVRGTDAVIEMARASGLDLTSARTRDAKRATSLGTGELIRAALDAGCRKIVLGVGGSANTDGGAGLLQGLGVRLLDASGVQIAPGGAALIGLDRADFSGLDPRLGDAELVLASDVDNPLLGDSGAASVFGPQKGASEADVLELDAALAHFVRVLDVSDDTLDVSATRVAQLAGAGAAGGVGFAALLLGAQRQAGIDVVLEFTQLEARIAGADFVVTGEGSFDEQSLMGKTPIGVARAAARAGIPTYVVCGRSLLSPEAVANVGISGYFAIADLEPNPEVSMAQAGPLLAELAEQLVTEVKRDVL